jgi:hypothetical protein
MKKQYLTIGVVALAILIAGGVLIHSWRSQHEAWAEAGTPATVSKPSKQAVNKPSKPSVAKPARVAKPAQANKPVKNAQAKPAKGAQDTVAVADLPAEVVAAAKKLMPDANIEVTQANTNKGVYWLALAADGKQGTAKLRVAKGRAVGTVNQDLAVSDLPPAIGTAFQQAVTNGTIQSASKVMTVGGKQDGEVTYEWVWGKNGSGEASADGKRVTLREPVGSDQLPAAVTAGVAQAYPQATVAKQAEWVIENGVACYSVTVKPADGGKKVSVNVAADGSILK